MFEFKLPDLGEGVHEGEVVNVLVKEGDTIAEYQPMLEVETDKAAVEIPAPKAGVITKIHVAPGETVKVGQTLITIDDSGAAPETGEPKAQVEAAPAAPPEPSVPETPTPAAEKAVATPPVAQPAEELPAREGPVPAAPAVRKLARELGVDISAVPGSGPRGRIVREDVEKYAGGERVAPSTMVGPALPAAAVSAELPDFSQYGSVRREKVPQIRKTIARQMTRAWLSVPRVTHCDTADVTELDRNRKAYNAGLREGETRLTMTAIVIKAIAASLRDFPTLNSSYDPASEEIIYKDYIHIGVAVDTPRGLVVPVLRDAGKKSLPEVAAELQQIGENARNAKFEIADLRGATFSITNYGAIGGRFGTPMVNAPECAILGMGRAKLEPAVHDGQIVPRLILPLSLSFDHRTVDGADAARFATDIIQSLENPLRLISLG